MTKAFFEDLAPGQVFTSDARAVVDAAAIKRFAGEFDRQPFHLDEASARATFFKELVASGWHTTALTMQLVVETLPLSHGIIGSGVDELRWPRPVRPGDTLHLHCEILAVTKSEDLAAVDEHLVDGDVETLLTLLHLGSIQRAAGAGETHPPAGGTRICGVLRAFLEQQALDACIGRRLERLLPP